MAQTADRENEFGHLDLSRRLAAASADVGDVNPALARELADESRALLKLVMKDDDMDEESDGRGPSEVLLHDDPDAACFRRFRAMQKQIVPPPDFGPSYEPVDQHNEPGTGRFGQSNGMLSALGRFFRWALLPGGTQDQTHETKRRPARSA